MLTVYGDRAELAPVPRHRAVPVAGDPGRAPSRPRARRWSPSRCAANRGGAGGAGLLVDHPGPGRARAAQHRRLPRRQGGGDHGADGARGVRHALDQARGDRQPRHAAARCVRAGRGRAHPGRRRLPGLPLHHRGPGRRRAPARCRLPGADALGGADRLRPRPRQPLCPAHPARPLPRRAAGDRRRHRPALARGRRPWSWATTPSCSTRPSPRPAIPSHGRGLPPRRRGRPRWASRPTRWSARDMAAPSTPVLGTAFLA